MFKSLRRKFVISSVLTVSVVIVLVAGCLNYVNYTKMIQKSDTYLSSFITNTDLLEIINDDTNENINVNTNSQKTGYSGFSAARINADKELKKYFNDDLSWRNRDISEYINKAISKDSYTGFVYDHRYLKVTINTDDTLILFYNNYQDLENFYSFFKNSIVISLVVILSVLVIMILISKTVISPLQQSYTKQKQFITDASHELKTPLTIIRSNTDVLELEHGESKWITNIQNQVDRLTSLVNSLVVFSRMEEKESIDKIQFNLTKDLTQRIDDFSELANFQEKEFNIKVLDDVSYFGEQQSIVQLIDILLDNAVKYAPKDSTINISLEKHRKYALLTINNNADVKKGELDRVFDRFYRLDASRNSNIKGYGIGLALAKLIAERHKEQITAYAPEDDIFEITMKFTLNDGNYY